MLLEARSSFKNLLIVTAFPMLSTILDHSNPKLVQFNKQQQLGGGGLKVKRSDMAEPLGGKIS